MSDIADQQEINRLNGAIERLTAQVSEERKVSARAVKVIAELTKERDEALNGDVLKMMRAQTKRAEAAEAQVARLREALNKIIADAPKKCPSMEDAADGGNYDDAWSSGVEAGSFYAAEIARKALEV